MSDGLSFSQVILTVGFEQAAMLVLCARTSLHGRTDTMSFQTQSLPVPCQGHERWSVLGQAHASAMTVRGWV